VGAGRNGYIGMVALLNASHGDSMMVINWRASHEHLRLDDVFFFCMAVVAAIAILVGFARTYFLAGMVQVRDQDGKDKKGWVTYGSNWNVLSSPFKFIGETWDGE
jgi:hypothetical protein